MAPTRIKKKRDMSAPDLVPIPPKPRSFACSSCKKRKSRCDAQRPICLQCQKAKTPCSYDDTPPRTPTEKLQDRIAELTQRVRELEGAANHSTISGSPGPSHRTQPGNAAHPSRWTNTPSPQSSSARLPSAPPDIRRSASETSSYNPQNFAGIHRSPGNGYEGNPARPTIADDVFPSGLNHYELVDVFLRHRHQAYFQVSIKRLSHSLAFSPTSRGQSSHDTPPSLGAPYLSLLNAIYLLASFFSRSSHWTSYEPLFLGRARRHIQVSLEGAEQLIHSIQASSLVAFYLHAKGRVLEGYYLSCATARFAVGCGLHKITSPEWQPPTSEQQTQRNARQTAKILDPPVDAIDLGERIYAWWQVWMIDQCAALSTSLPPALSTSVSDPVSRIDTCWPLEFSAFEGLGNISPVPGNIQSLYDPNHRTRHRDSIPTLITKATELCVRAWRLSKHSEAKTELFWATFQETDAAISAFARTLPYVCNTGTKGELPPATPPVVNLALVLPNSLALASTIQLHWIVALEHDHLHPSYQRCMDASADMMSIINGIIDFDLSFLELHIGPCWKLTAEVISREILRLRRMNDASGATIWQGELDTIQLVKQRLCLIFPVLGELWELS